jgi:glycosyltransferase involved in cell wall biosynthesis
LGNLRIAQRMGRNGRRAVIDNYNWPTESEKLIGLYRELHASIGNMRRAGT